MAVTAALVRAARGLGVLLVVVAPLVPAAAGELPGNKLLGTIATSSAAEAAVTQQLLNAITSGGWLPPWPPWGVGQQRSALTAVVLACSVPGGADWRGGCASL